MDRKSFIRNSTLVAFSMSTMGWVVRGKDNSFAGNCETTNDILGPFYRENAPERFDLTYEGLVGCRIRIKGVVYGPDCTTPVADAKIEIWHCNTQGSYDNDSDEYLHRGSQKTSATGTYSFQTIMPGKYLNDTLYRPSHIHFRVTAHGKNELISQLYFQGDPHIADDPWASDESAKHRTLSVFPDETDGSLSIEFPIYLSNA